MVSLCGNERETPPAQAGGHLNTKSCEQVPLIWHHTSFYCPSFSLPSKENHLNAAHFAQEEKGKEDGGQKKALGGLPSDQAAT